jgi:hypothetical protein
MAGAEVPVAGPIEVGGADSEAAGEGTHAPERVETDRDHFLADAVAGYDGELDVLQRWSGCLLRRSIVADYVRFRDSGPDFR